MKINRIFNGFAAGKKYSAVPWCVLLNLLWVYLCYGVCRIAFYFENLELFQDPLTRATAFDWLSGGFIFDTSAIAYTNALYLLLVLLPFTLEGNATVPPDNQMGVCHGQCRLSRFQPDGCRLFPFPSGAYDRHGIR